MRTAHIARLLAVAAVSGGFALQAMPAAAVIDNDAATCSISGSAAWGSTVTAVPGSHAFTFPLTWTCTSLLGDEGGTWTINFFGTSPDESCTSGHALSQASGSVEGQGVGNANVVMTQSDNVFTFDGTVGSASETHHVHAQVTVSVPTCNWAANTSFAASGSGTLADAS